MQVVAYSEMFSVLHIWFGWVQEGWLVMKLFRQGLHAMGARNVIGIESR